MKKLKKKELQLLGYSEWLDAYQKLMKKPKDDDSRTHLDLVREFLSR